MEICLLTAKVVTNFELSMTKEQFDDAKSVLSFISKPQKLNINLKPL
jgi:hypothetical protein